MKLTEYTAYDAVGLAQLVASGDVTAHELEECAVQAHHQVADQINAVVAIHRPESSANDDVRVSTGPLAGVPTMVKDLFHGVAGLPCGNGSRLTEGWIAPYTSTLVSRLKAAGMINVGRTATSEFGILGTTETLANGQTRSPWSLDHMAGGSSGGSAAAVGAGVVPAALASDGGGSIRIPASACGVVGLKPSAGRVPWGYVTKEPLLGWAVQFAVTRTVRDSATLLDAFCGPVVGDPFGFSIPSTSYAEAARTPPGPLRIAYWCDPWSGDASDPVITDATKRTAELLESMGHHVEMATPEAAWDRYLPAMANVWAATNAHTIDGIAGVLGREVNESTVEGSTLGIVEHGRQVSAQQLLAAMDLETHLTYVMAEFFQRFDVLLTPTLATVLPRLGAYDPHEYMTPTETFATAARWECFLPVFNTTGQPAISLPLHQSPDGLPIGMQFVGAVGREDLLLSLATTLEEALPWSVRRPPVFAA